MYVFVQLLAVMDYYSLVGAYNDALLLVPSRKKSPQGMYVLWCTVDALAAELQKRDLLIFGRDHGQIVWDAYLN